MGTEPLMKKALGSQWEQLPEALKRHYQGDNNTDTGALDIEYPGFMQPYLTVMRLFGALINQRGKKVPTTAFKKMQGDRQYWERTINFPDGRVVLFRSQWSYAGGNELIEYVNAFLGLRMSVHVHEDKLYYQGIHYVIKLGSVLLPIPEWLILGHTTIEEKALDEESFVMDFRLQHPLFGQVFRYAGEFRTR